MESNKNKDLQAATKIINEYLKIDVIICFAKHSEVKTADNFLKNDQEIILTWSSYHLLIISETSVPDIIDLQKTVNERLSPDTEVYLLIHNIEYITEAVVHNHFFFQAIMKRSSQLGFQTCFNSYQGENARIHKKGASALWMEYHQRATTFQESATRLLGINDPVEALRLIAKSFEQACMGLLTACLDYQPKSHNLCYLLPLCDLISTDFHHIIPRKTKQGKAFLDLLAGGRNNNTDLLRDNSLVVFSLNHLCTEFLKESKKIFETYHQNDLRGTGR